MFLLLSSPHMVRVSKQILYKLHYSIRKFYYFLSSLLKYRYPGKVTTFVLPVVEIESIILQLTSLRDKTQYAPTTSPTALEQSEYVRINSSIGNWNKVLNTYRKQTTEAKTALYRDMKCKFVDFFSICNNFL